VKDISRKYYLFNSTVSKTWVLPYLSRRAAVDGTPGMVWRFHLQLHYLALTP